VAEAAHLVMIFCLTQSWFRRAWRIRCARIVLQEIQEAD
jgi:hypothetical protein